MYNSMRQIMKVMPWVITTLYDNNITIQELSYGQDIAVKGIDTVERNSLQRLGAISVSLWYLFGDQMLTVCFFQRMGGKVNAMKKAVDAMSDKVTSGHLNRKDSSQARRSERDAQTHSRRSSLLEHLTEDILRFDRLTEANLYLLNCKGFLRAVTELIVRQLPSIHNGNFVMSFNTWFFKIMFTDRLASHFYVDSSQ